MRIVIATPLYPPEIADAAAYAKELAGRLSEHHDVTVVAYTHLPEQLPGVTVMTIDKRQPRLVRLFAFRRALAKAARRAEAVLAVNGASVELPLLLTRLPKSTKIALCVADAAAHKRGGIIEQLTFARAGTLVYGIPPRKPEILPLEPEPTEELSAYERAWQTHLAALDTIFRNAN